MQFNKLRLLGFKSFVEPTDFAIEKGLTGVVGPNGCGKSNLVEALRWVMGENSYKNMRASSMDDVIFSGSGHRPSRNTAEVGLFLDNSSRTAPAMFNEADELQVTRRIERESGSTYRINGKEVRAKDVQLLFADASTGARSPSMIGQGRIGELISAKPQSRRALLEEAAGISGLHSRRHEAELRLRASETNLDRLEDVIAQMDSQLESLKRQARQANRFRNLAGDIRKAEATLLHLRWLAAKEAESATQSSLSEAIVKVGEQGLIQGDAAKAQAVIAHKIPELRDAEAAAAAKLQHLTIQSTQLDEEQRRVEARETELKQRVQQLESDLERERRLIEENQDILLHLEKEEALLSAETGNAGQKAEAAKQQVETTRAALNESEVRQQSLTNELATANAERRRVEGQIADLSRQLDQTRQQQQKNAAELEQLDQRISQTSDVFARQQTVDSLEQQLIELEAAVTRSEEALASARQAQSAARQPVEDARREVGRIETESKTLSRILNSGGGDLFPPVVERMKVRSGYETALGSVLGDDLELPLDAAAPAYWSSVDVADVPELPQGTTPLSEFVEAPTELRLRLSQIGVVDDEVVGQDLSTKLKVGQRLVARSGAMWRWDGLVVKANAPSAAAQRLEQKNRLAVLDAEAVTATKALREQEELLDAARQAMAHAEGGEQAARQAWRDAQKALNDANRLLAESERRVGELSNRKAALEEASKRLETTGGELETTLGDARISHAELPDTAKLESELQTLAATVLEQRAAANEARVTFDGLARENELRSQRLSAIGRERKSWTDRRVNADVQIARLSERKLETEREQAALADAPSELVHKKRELVALLEKAQSERQVQADALAQAENNLAEADKLARDAVANLADAKENAARCEERLNASKERRQAAEDRIREDLACQPHEAISIAELADGKPLPAEPDIERRLERLRSERERLGAVNLRAEEEQREISAERDKLVTERDDLIEAIKKLRQGIQSLNREGRERLLAAFDRVNDEFKRLFTHLFGGGEAELQLIESDDPLESGLEILAMPPGKKPQTMTLLSGGEQALTALALIFAVFLTNPAPICVLDEVDAPLDDHNVDRFCNLMDEMAATTDTRFVLITHNPITMARVNRLFGVTMAERGVSQLVSVDLETAERIRDAG
ncbi:MAG: chromosome segregation protein SMC [Pseudomonadota bacterium]